MVNSVEIQRCENAKEVGCELSTPESAAPTVDFASDDCVSDDPLACVVVHGHF